MNRKAHLLLVCLLAYPPHRIDDYDIKYGLIEQLKYILLKQAVFEHTGALNPTSYFGGLHIVDMNDEIVDNELKKIFVGEKERKKLERINKHLLAHPTDIVADARPSSISYPTTFVPSYLEKLRFKYANPF